MKIGIVCGYDWDVAGGVQFHIRDLVEELTLRGHTVKVLAPATGLTAELPSYLTPAGKSFAIKFNGSVARLAFGVKAWKTVRAWLRQNNFDVLHIHEPFTPSVSLFSLWQAKVPVVATFHTATEQFRLLKTVSPLLKIWEKKITARIAVSAEALRTLRTYLGKDAQIIPNGVYVQNIQKNLAVTEARYTGTALAPTLAFLGRIDEPRKGLPVLAKAWPEILATYPEAKLFVAGVGDKDKARALFGSYLQGVEFLGPISEAEKARLLGNVDIYVAPNTGGESFGIILVEAMSARATILASDIAAFQAVLGNGNYGAHYRNKDAADLAKKVLQLLADPNLCTSLAQAAQEAAQKYDWSQVATDILHVYERAVNKSK